MRQPTKLNEDVYSKLKASDWETPVQIKVPKAQDVGQFANRLRTAMSYRFREDTTAKVRTSVDVGNRIITVWLVEAA